MSKAPKMKTIANQPSYILATKTVEAAITQRAAMLAPVTFFRDTAPLQPYSIAPWAEERLDPGTPQVVACLRGDFLCSAFGGNDEPFEGKRLPVHGETANEVWDFVSFDKGKGGVVLRQSIRLSLQGGGCDKTTALVEKHNIVYQRDDFSGVNGPINPGHHAMLRFPDKPGCARLSFSPFVYAHTFVEPTEHPEKRGYSILKPNAPVSDLTGVPRSDGALTDVTVFPARRGFDDIMIICADPSREFAWSAVTFSEDGYVWFTLRDPRLLPSTLLWMSNGGRYYAPWNGRHVNVLGVEDMTGFFHYGLAASARDNLLTQKGIKTCHRLKPSDTLRIPYVQGIARVPKGFDRVASIEIESDASIKLTAPSGATQSVPCFASFVKTGEIKGLIQ